jgi:hypothetical protein
VGEDGKTCRTRTMKRGARVTITLAQYSATNDLFAGLLLADAVRGSSGVGGLPLFINDRSGRGLWTATHAWIAGFPEDVSLRSEVTERVWVIECAELLRFDGGN